LRFKIKRKLLAQKNVFTFFFFILSLSVFAQNNQWKNPNFRQISIKNQSIITLDSLDIISETFVLKDSLGNIISTSDYTLNIENATVYLLPKFLNKTVIAEYYTVPNSYSKNFSAKDSSLIVSDFKPIKYYQLQSDLTAKNTIFGKLNSQGSIVRGITFGNNQNASVQSSLDLRLEGKLSKDVSIAANIYDNNVKIEQGGYTQNINEFENFSIELFNKNSKIKAGFIDVVQMNNYFANFNKKVMGLEVSTLLQHKNSQTKIAAVGSLSRGEFYRFQFVGVEGNQGPYKLNGKNGETFIVILPNSERVFLDGILLQSGEDKDYIINNNTGEITFTNKRVVNANSRYTIEYQYNTRNYNRYLLYSSVEHNRERFSISGTVFSESDSKNSPVNQDLNDDEKNILANAGNDVNQMYSISATPTEFATDKILYQKITVGSETIFEYSTNNTVQLYTVSFIFLGKNKGNYKKLSNEVNGRIFEYVAPISGVLQGEYEPIKRLAAPEKLQVYTLNSTYQINKFDPNQKIGINVAISAKDKNLFSSLGDGDNNGFAGRLFYTSYFKKNNWESYPSINYSFLHKNFAIIDRIQSIEFNRDFNRKEEFSNVNQHKISANWKNSFGKYLKIDYTFDLIDEDTIYNGMRNIVYAKFEKNLWKIKTIASYLNTKDSEEKTQFTRYNASVERQLKSKFTVGTDIQGENNSRKNRSGILSNLSFRWNEIGAYSHYGDSTKFNFKTRIYTRTDDSVRLGVLQNITKSKGIMLSSLLINRQYQTLSVDAHYRTIDYSQIAESGLGNEAFLIGNLKWSKGFWQNGLALNLQYMLESGREAEREFQYVKVTEGLGIYKWTDYNNNGVQELDEFEVSEFQDNAKYIRVFLNNISYIKANKNGLNASVSIQPENIFKTNKAFWERFRTRISYTANTAFYKNNDVFAWNPFEKENSINKNESTIALINFNKISQNKWDFMYKFTKFNNTRTVFLGKESQDRYSHTLQNNYRILKNFIVGNELSYGQDANNSELFTTKNYTLSYHKIEPSITYQIEKEFSAKAFYSFKNKENLLGNETLHQQEIGTDIRWENSKTSLVAKFSFIQNNLNGNSFSLVANQMMDGLQVGNNTVWNLVMQRQLSSFLVLNLNYQGRKNEATSAIHIGSVQLKAIF